MFDLNVVIDTLVYPLKEERARKPLFYLGLKLMVMIVSTYIVGYGIIFVGMLLFEIPVLGWLLYIVSWLLGVIILMVSQVFILGLKYETQKARMQTDQFYIPVVNSSTILRQMYDGLRLLSLRFIYYIPLIVIFGIMLVPIIFLVVASDGESTAEVISVVLFVLVYLFAYLVYLVYSVAVVPMGEYLFMKTDRVGSSLSFSKTFKLTKKYWKGLLVYLLALIITGMIVGFVLMVAYFLIFLCIGIILYPLALGLGAAYITLIEGNVKGQLYRHIDQTENQE